VPAGPSASSRAEYKLICRGPRRIRFPSQIRRFDLRTGYTISANRPPKEGERYFALIKV